MLQLHTGPRKGQGRQGCSSALTLHTILHSILHVKTFLAGTSHGRMIEEQPSRGHGNKDSSDMER